MNTIVELWTYLSASPLFGLTATLVVYVLAHAGYTAAGQAPWANPVLWTVLVLVALLSATDTEYNRYFAGAQFIHFLLGPAVVALAWPLWLRRRQLRQRWFALLAAALAGGAAAAGSAVAIGWAPGLPPELLRSLAPKSITAPVAMGIAQQIDGIPALAAVFAVLSGLTGALCAKYLFNAMGMASMPVRGFALGTVSHGIGAARAMQVHTDAGAYAALALGMQAILGAMLIPLFIRLSG